MTDDSVHDHDHRLNVDDLVADHEFLLLRLERGDLRGDDYTLQHLLRVQLPELIALLKNARARTPATEVLRTLDYQVMRHDGNLVDEPTGGWMPVSSVTSERADAVERVVSRRVRFPDGAPTAIWRREVVWSVEATESEIASNDGQ